MQILETYTCECGKVLEKEKEHGKFICPAKNFIVIQCGYCAAEMSRLQWPIYVLPTFEKLWGLEICEECKEKACRFLYQKNKQ